VNEVVDSMTKRFGEVIGHGEITSHTESTAVKNDKPNLSSLSQRPLTALTRTSGVSSEGFS
jgi:hypothetical protein